MPITAEPTHDSQAPLGSRRRALWVVVLLPAALFLLAARLLDVPCFVRGRAESRVAAIAIRDPVAPMETLATWGFVRPRLRAAYAETRLLTQARFRLDQPFILDPETEFLAAMRELAARHDAIDIWCLSHSNRFVSWVEQLEPEVRTKIRFVYNSGCWDARHSKAWLAAGADTYVAHPSAASHIAFFVPFFRRLLGGVPLSIAVPEANDFASRLYGTLAWFGAPLHRELEAWQLSLAQVHGQSEHVHGGVR